MKIGIVTFWDSRDNYGQQLQLFALHESVKNLGHEPYLIRYDRNREPVKRLFWRVFNPYAVVMKMLEIIKRKKAVKSIAVQPSRHFDEFRKKYINESKGTYTIGELRICPPEADVYISGSDQVWRSNNPADFLDFGPDSTKRISYAASFGLDSFPKESMALKKNFLRRFQHISVREEDGLELCKRMGYQDAVCVLDPTMLLNRDYYISKFSLKEEKPKKKYILLYLLGSLYGTNINEIMQFANDNNLDVMYADTHGQNNTYPKIYPTTEKWVELILNSEMVITNSFHGTVFSILMHKKFCAIRKGQSDGRLYTLLSKVNLSDRIFDANFDFCLNTEIDYSKVEKSLEPHRKFSLDYLVTAISK